MIDTELEITVNDGEYCLDSRVLAKRLGNAWVSNLQAGGSVFRLVRRDFRRNPNELFQTCKQAARSFDSYPVSIALQAI